ncbi:NEP1-interacting protein-like 2 [Andrographis paniculata]|uniref:NEP1-interacting protein-like 2 n=1 Tax=Andrographis paniculata TaxID=175694 RepID=UPI0021E6E80C|nr:NEP1-interacting protein-like 2 [Andrographis paniculata]
MVTMMMIRCSAALSRLRAGLTECHFRLIFVVVEKLALTLAISIFALGGAAIGAITGAVRGNTTETGLLRGFGVGAVAGAITGVRLWDLVSSGEPFSKVAVICSVLNGKIFVEWMNPAILKPYQWQWQPQVTTTNPSFMEIPEIFEANAVRRLRHSSINELPVYVFCSDTKTRSSTRFTETTCAICLQDLENGEHARILPTCRHFFHRACIDEWLMQQATCPVCRRDV